MTGISTRLIRSNLRESQSVNLKPTKRNSRYHVFAQIESAPIYSSTPATPVTFFLISIVLPWIIVVGPTILGPYRFVLLATVLPCFFRWLSGSIRFIATDFIFLSFCIWGFISLMMVQGFDAGFQPSGTLFVETMGAYLLGRCFIRNADDFYMMVRFIFIIILIIFPFCLIETITGYNVFLKLSGLIFTVHTEVHDVRWGFKRVQAFFEHPILFGVVTANMLGLVHITLGYHISQLKRWLKSGIVVLVALTSLSAGPFSGLAAQFALIFWNYIFHSWKQKWMALCFALGAVYLTIELVSNQSAPHFYLTYFSFSSENAYFRILIWEFGTQSVLNHPLFGSGFGNWDRPYWMPPSIDMFWLYNAITYGIPAGLLMLAGYASLIIQIGVKKIADPRISAYRLAYMFSMLGFFIVGWTVHYWNATYVLFMFLIGSGAWMLHADPAGAAGAQDGPEGSARHAAPGSRLPPHPRRIRS